MPVPDEALEDEPGDDVPPEDESEPVPEDPDEPDESLDDELEEDSDDEPEWLDELDVEPRLSVLKKPAPLNVTPTGVNTFFTGLVSPVSGWASSVRVSSWNPCWTSIVSPVSTNL